MQPANVSLWLRSPVQQAQPKAWHRTWAAVGTDRRKATHFRQRRGPPEQCPRRSPMN